MFNRLLYLMFCEFVKLIKPYQSCIQLFILSLCCIGANKVVHVFSVEKVIMFDFFLLGHDSLFRHRITMLWFHKNKIHGPLFPSVDCLWWVFHNVMVSATSSCTTAGHPVVLSSEKGQNYEGDTRVPTGGCHIFSPWNSLKALHNRGSIQETNARYYSLSEPIV